MQGFIRKWPTLFATPRIMVLALLILLVTAPSSAADDEASVEFEGKDDRVVEIRVTSGRVFVTGTDGNTVLVRARVSNADHPVAVAEEPTSDDPRATGLRKITHSATGLETWADGNVVTVATQSFGEAVELFVSVPRDARVDIGSHFADSVSVVGIHAPVYISSNGSVHLSGINGNVEVSTAGWVYLSDLSGSVVVNSQFGGIEGSLREVDPDRPISLSATGPIDIALPEGAKATLHMKTSFGEVFTDFDMKVTPRKKGAYEVYAPIHPVPVVSKVVVPDEAVPAPSAPSKSDEKDQPAPSARSDYDRAVRAHARAVRNHKRVEESMKRVQERIERITESAPYVTPSGSPAVIGNINGGGAQIRLTSMSGNIYIRRIAK